MTRHEFVATRLIEVRIDTICRLKTLTRRHWLETVSRRSRGPIGYFISSNMTNMETPCIDICFLDPATGLCEGCRRTLDEIARWATMSNEERHRIMADLPNRPAPRNARRH